MTLHLLRPEWLWLLLPAAALTALLWQSRRRRGGWDAVIDAVLLAHLVAGPDAGRAGRGALALICLGWLLAILAASGPSWQKIPQPVLRKQDALVVLLDLSASMKAADLAPARIDRARQKVHDLLLRRREGQTGLIAYAGDPHVVTPLTDDTATIANLLPALHPDMMPVPGSDAAAAVREGLELLRSAGIRGGGLLLITDGVDAADRAAIAERLRGSGVRLSVLGVGTATGAPIPLSRGGFLRNAAGAIVMPGLDARSLRELAAASGGRFQGVRIDDSDLATLLAPRTGVASEQHLDTDHRADTWADMGYLLIVPLLPLVLGLFRRGWLLTAVPLLLLAQPQGARAGPWDDLWLTPDQQGQRALEAGAAARAAELFEDPAWAGTANYENGDYAAAARNFAQRDDADAWYNRGHALARAGRLDDAIAAYRESLARDPERADAQQSLALVQSLRDRQRHGETPSGDGAADRGQGQDPQETGRGRPAHDPARGSPSPGEPGADERAQHQEPQPGRQQNPSGGGAAQQPPPAPDTAGGKHGTGPAGEPAGPEQAQRGNAATTPDTHGQGAPDAAAEDAPQGPAAVPGGALDLGELEHEQAREQWLRRIPDDPAGLLREKFRYESRRRQQVEEDRRDDETPW